ncbi:alpha/beta hydrolase [Pseudoflavitalea sp. G-6-1-2]|uniref:alpha/beta fold hydrolase n=1 Tax=Pseudoflavitalea sp. G-6-1-2 TaxID=2728841 RepID=UPI00146D3495|nr:alpha/beta hydrolase [Pseudoflavitalea sp. G-6-1-2]NML19928.1 alpha/beta hydrolase [Pseudoflavitalea sp. G-6-1-2]
METIVLLHGAVGAASQLKPLADALGKDYKVHYFNLKGHGGEPMPDEPFSIEMFAQQVLDYFEQHQLQSPIVFGYSLGGYVGMYIARHYPGKISRLITLATKYEWSPEIAAKEGKNFDAEKIEAKVPAFAAQLAKLHAPGDWKLTLKKVAELLHALGNRNALGMEDYPQINIPVLVMVGDRDRMVSIEETVGVYRALPAATASLCILPGTPHPLEQVNLHQILNQILQK